MGVWIYGWVEKMKASDDSNWWEAVFDMGEYVGRKAWWNIPILGHTGIPGSPGTLDNIFEPLPSERGIPEKVSNIARFNMANATTKYGDTNKEYKVNYPSLDKLFSDPKENVMTIERSDLKKVDWDEERNELEDQLREFKKETKARHEKEITWKNSYIEMLNKVFRVEKKNSDEEKLGRFWTFDELDQDDKINIVENGSITKDGSTFESVKTTRRDYLPERWFEVMDIMENIEERQFKKEEKSRLLIWFNH